MTNYSNVSSNKKNKESKAVVPTINNAQKQVIEDEDKIVTPTTNNEQTNTPESKVTVDPIIGYVSNCEKLNIRNAPDLDSEILIVVNKGTKVEISEELSNDEFYSVTAYCPDDITVIGYAMKDFITLN